MQQLKALMSVPEQLVHLTWAQAYDACLIGVGQCSMQGRESTRIDLCSRTASNAQLHLLQATSNTDAPSCSQQPWN